MKIGEKRKRSVVVSFEKLLLTITVFSAILLSGFLVVPGLLADKVTAAIEPVSCSSSHDVVTCLDFSINEANLAMIIDPIASANPASSRHIVNTKTNAPGYKLFISTETFDTGMVYQNPTTIVPAPTIPATTGSITSPGALENNSWGFAVPGTGSFDSSYGVPVPASTSKWAAVPGAPGLVKETSAASGTVGDVTTVYYGVKIDLSQPAGFYGVSVVYTVTPKPFPAPAISDLTQSVGFTSGGTSTVITGVNFYDIELVAIGGVACNPFTVDSPTQITCVTPAGTPGAKNVVVVTAHGVATLNNGFTYQPPGPIITGICRIDENCSGNTSSGHFRGGETFIITGTLFTGATSVRLGGSDCRSFTVDSATQITCLSPPINASFLNSNNIMANPTNVVDVVVTTALGTSTGGAGLFTYRYPNLSFTNAGTFLNIITTDVTFGSRIQVAGTDCLMQTIISPTAMSCTPPPLSTGTRGFSFTVPPVSQGNMQNWTGCSAIATPPYTTTNLAPYTRILTDTRNGQDYRVRKLPDGKCWMIDNLKLATPGTALTLTSANSNVSANFTLPPNPVNTAATRRTNGVCHSSNSAGATGSGGSLTCDGTATDTAGTPANTNNNFIAWTDPGDVANTVAGENCRPGAPGLDLGSLSGCGYLYNWFTATAGSGTYAVSTDGQNAMSSLCPAGWRLPSAGTGTANAANELAVLNGLMLNGGVPSTTSTPASRPNWRAAGQFAGTYSGGWNGSFVDQGLSGRYWSSSVWSATSVRMLTFAHNSVYTGDVGHMKSNGSAVRCVLN